MQIRQIAVIALILAGAVACTSSGSDDPTSTPTSTAPTSTPAPTTPTPTTISPSPTPTVATTGPNVRPGEKPPTLMSPGDHNSPAGADAYARYWMSALDWAYATNSSTLARSLFVASCTQCDHFLSFDIDQVHRLNQHYADGRLAVVASQIVPTDGHAGATAVVDLTVTQQPFKLLADNGSTVDQSARATTVTFRTWLRWTGTWRVVDWKTVTKK